MTQDQLRRVHVAFTASAEIFRLTAERAVAALHASTEPMRRLMIQRLRKHDRAICAVLGVRYTRKWRKMKKYRKIYAERQAVNQPARWFTSLRGGVGGVLRNAALP